MDNSSSLWSNVRRTLRTYRRIAGKELAGYCFAATGQVALVLMQTWFGGRIINDLVRVVSRHQTNTKLITFDISVLIASGILEQMCWALLTFFEKRAYHKWSRHNYFTFLEKTSRLSLGQFEDKKLRQELNVLWQEGYAWKPVNFAQELLYVFHAGLRTCATFVILVTLLPILIPILLIASLPTLFVEKHSASVKWGIWGAKGDDSQTFWSISTLLHNRDSVLEITPQGSRDYLLGKADKAIANFLNAQVKVLQRFLFQVLSTRLFEGLVVGGINVWLLVRVITTRGAFTIGQYSIYAGIVQQFQSSTSTVYKSAVNIFDLNHFMSIYYHFLDSQSPVLRPAKPVKLAKDAPITIEYREVSFAYPKTKKLILESINLTIKPGDHIALVGENGAGKSTLIKLLLRFYDVTSGQILVNGTDIRELDLESWYYHIGALFQAFNHYPLTLNENITIGRAKQPPQTGLVTKAMQLAGLTNLAGSFDYGDATVLDPSFEKGVELSGGQWQKVALARAFYRDADILILDEPTSAVDAKAEYEIFQQIHKTQADKTTIVVSHRFSTVRQADRILVVNHGTIEEDGSHADLLARKGLYKEMFDKQAAGYR
jgi:ATP-binding cassette subfamily B protein